MIVSVKDTAKLLGISVIACCAVMVCTLFLNFYWDIRLIEGLLSSPQEIIYYNAQVSTAKIVCLLCGGCLSLTSVVMLLFDIKHYIDTHKKELGILKALGMPAMKAALHFWVFGTGIFLGTAVGFGGAFLLMPTFYRLQNKDALLPPVTIGFHPSLLFFLVILPTAAYAALAVLYTFFKLHTPVMGLLKDNWQQESYPSRSRGRNTSRHVSYCAPAQKAHVPSRRPDTFLDTLRKNTLRTRKALVFFILFGSFCYASMTQMSASMRELSSVMMGIMMLVIGLVLAFTTLFLAISTVVKGNRQTIAMMRTFGYSQAECCQALLGCYRPVSCLGFALGTLYQYELLRIMVDLVFRDFESMPVYTFDFPVMFLSLGSFIAVYELMMYRYSRRIGKISVKEIMLE